MKKLITLVAVLFFLSVVVPTQAQHSPPVSVALSAMIEGGCYLEISPTAVGWSSISVPTSPAEAGLFIPHDGVPIDLYVSYRLQVGNHLRLTQETLSDLDYGDGDTLDISQYVKQNFAGDIVYTGMVKLFSVGSLQIYNSVDNVGDKSATIQFEFKNDAGMKPGTVTATISYTAVDST